MALLFIPSEYESTDAPMTPPPLDDKQYGDEKALLQTLNEFTKLQGYALVIEHSKNNRAKIKT